MGMRIDNRFKYFKDINEALKRKYDTTEDFPYSEMVEAIDNIPSGGEFPDADAMLFPTESEVNNG